MYSGFEEEIGKKGEVKCQGLESLLFPFSGLLKIVFSTFWLDKSSKVPNLSHLVSNFGAQPDMGAQVCW